MDAGAHIVLDGEIRPHADGLLPVEERSTLFSESVYEVIRFYEGRPFRLKSHEQRMANSLEGIGLGVSVPDLRMDSLSRELIRLNDHPNGIVYWQVGAADAPRELAPHEDPGARHFAVCYEAPPLRREGIPSWSAITMPDQRWHRCDIKTTMLLPNLLALREAKRAGCDAAILHRGETVTEANTANCFAVRAGVLRTHPANQWILNGVTRGALFDCIAELGMPIEERALLRRELLTADEVFLCGTTTQLTAIREIDGAAIGTGEPGPVSIQLYEALRERIIRECGLDS